MVGSARVDRLPVLTRLPVARVLLQRDIAVLACAAQTSTGIVSRFASAANGLFMSRPQTHGCVAVSDSRPRVPLRNGLFPIGVPHPRRRMADNSTVKTSWRPILCPNLIAIRTQNQPQRVRPFNLRISRIGAREGQGILRISRRVLCPECWIPLWTPHAQNAKKIHCYCLFTL